MAEINGPAQYVRQNSYRGAAGKVFFCMHILSKTYQCWGRKHSALIAALITELRSGTSSMSILILFPGLVLVGIEHQAKAGTWVKPHLAGVSNTWLHQFPAAHDGAAQTLLLLNGRGQESAELPL